MFTSKTQITDPMTRDALKKLGSEWGKSGKHRVYFNDLPELYGLDVRYYNTGNVSSATLDGEAISNSEAKRLLNRLTGKFYFDFADGRFHSFDLDDEIAGELVGAIKSRLAQAPAPEITIPFSVTPTIQETIE